MTTTAPVHHYKVYHWTPRTARRLEHTVTIELFFNRRKVGVIHFYPDSSSKALQDKVYAQSSGSVIYLEFHERQYPQVIDLLRNESVTAVIEASAGTPGSFTNGEGRLETAKEPGGEGETA